MPFECWRMQWNSLPTHAMLVLLGSTLMACDAAAAGAGVKWNVSQAKVAKTFERLAANTSEVPLLDCKWTLQNAPNTFYVPYWLVNTSITIRTQVLTHLPAAGYTRVWRPSAALWLLTGLRYNKVFKTLRVCRQQLVGGGRHSGHKLHDLWGLRKLASQHPWTQASDMYPPTFAIGRQSDCERWRRRVEEQLRQGSPLRHPDAPAWVLKAPSAHYGAGIRFLPWDFAKGRDVAQICEQHRGWVVQQMVHSATVFRGGSAFSLRVMALMASAAPLKVVWSRARAAHLMFATPPANSTGVDARYLTNSHARPDPDNWEEYIALAAPAFDGLRRGLWEDCIAPQLKIAIVAYMLHMLSALRVREPNNFNNFGCDFLVDEDLRAHFLECNEQPGVSSTRYVEVHREVYPVVLHEVRRRSGAGAAPAPDVLRGYEVVLDEETGYAFTSPRVPRACGSVR